MSRCTICGKSLQPPRRSYCSEQCAAEGRLQYKRVKVRKPRPEPVTYYERVCPDCGVSVLMHIKSKRCAECQLIADRIHDAEHKRAKAAGHTRKIGNLYPCEVCGELYELASGKQRYCTNCAAHAAAESSRAASRAWYTEHYASEDKRKERMAKRRTRWQEKKKICEVCSSSFLPGNPRQNVCSDACRAVHRKQKQRAYDVKRKGKHAAKVDKKEATMIPYTDFLRLLTDVSECRDLESYVAECGGSVPLDDAEDAIRLLTVLWGMSRSGLTIKSISAACDISVRQIALRYGLPTRTVENWAGEKTAPPVWQLPLIAYAVMSDYIAD